MNRLFLLVVCILACISCSANPITPRAPERAPDITTVRVYRTFERTIHADVDFTPLGRALIRDAAGKWNTLSPERIKLDVVFDLDFDSVAGLAAHEAAKHTLLMGIESKGTLARALDDVLGSPGKTPLAATVTNDDDSVYVYVVLDRIEPDHFVSVVTHELGHVIGFPDLPTSGDIMSGASLAGAPPVNVFTKADIALCQSALLCD